MACCRGGCSHPPAKATAAASQRADASIDPYEGRTKVRDKGEYPPNNRDRSGAQCASLQSQQDKAQPLPRQLKAVLQRDNPVVHAGVAAVRREVAGAHKLEPLAGFRVGQALFKLGVRQNGHAFRV